MKQTFVHIPLMKSFVVLLFNHLNEIEAEMKTRKQREQLEPRLWTRSSLAALTVVLSCNPQRLLSYTGARLVVPALSRSRTNKETLVYDLD